MPAIGRCTRPLQSESEACIEENRQYWSDQQQHFRRLLHSDRYAEAIHAFLEQHAMLHTASLVSGYHWSFQDEISADLTDEQLRQIPTGHLQSIAWVLWHIARTEDVTMNMLLANTDQLLYTHHWFEHLSIPTRDIGTEMSATGIAVLSARIDIPAGRAYRRAVGQRTREIVQQVKADEWRQRIEPAQIEWVKAEGAVVPAAYGVAEYWGRHNKGNLLLIPATRHSFTHLNEAGRMRQRLRQ
jgi:DinB family protein